MTTADDAVDVSPRGARRGPQPHAPPPPPRAPPRHRPPAPPPGAGAPGGGGGGTKRIATPAPPDARAPEKGDAVTVHYVGSLATGETFDSSRERDEAFTFTLGKHEVIDAWDVGVATMRVGERATLTCAPEYAYGDRGAPPKLTRGAARIFDVELVWVK